jgi:hypothetical protein
MFLDEDQGCVTARFVPTGFTKAAWVGVQTILQQSSCGDAGFYLRRAFKPLPVDSDFAN